MVRCWFCAGVYPEQVFIHQPVTLKGVPIGRIRRRELWRHSSDWFRTSPVACCPMEVDSSGDTVGPNTLVLSTVTTCSWGVVFQMDTADLRIRPFFGGCRKPREAMWCGRRESNPHEPFKLCGFSYQLRLSPPGYGSILAIRFVVWTIPSPSPGISGA